MNELLMPLLISGIINSFAILELFLFRGLIQKQYENIRNYFMRGKGYGYIILMHPEGRLKPYFKKIEPTIRLKDKETYAWKSQSSFRYNSLPACLYIKGQSLPIDLKDKENNDLWDDAAFLDNLNLNIKAGAEAEAEANGNKTQILLLVIIVMQIILFLAIGFLLYLAQGGDLGTILNAQPV
jgi:hypothetical protein